MNRGGIFYPRPFFGYSLDIMSERARKRGSLIIYPITERGYALAEKAAGAFDGAVIHKPEELRNGGLKRLVKKEFRESRALFFISASGIAVRSIAPHLKGKAVDPAVVVMDEASRFIISLVSGHLGGANRLTNELAEIYKATPVITTATDIMGLPCAEDISERFGFTIENPKKIKKVNSAILKGGKIAIIGCDPKRLAAIKKVYKKFPVFDFLKSFPENTKEHDAFISVSGLSDPFPSGLKDDTLVMRPKEFMVGVGCGRGVSVREVEKAYRLALKKAGISPLSVKGLATIDIKKDEAGLIGFAKKIGLDLGFFSAKELNAIKPPSGVSKMVLRKTGAAGVSEPAALLSAGVKKIWQKKIREGQVTVAIARVPFGS